MITRALQKPKMHREHHLGRFYISGAGIFKIFILWSKMSAVYVKKWPKYEKSRFFQQNGQHFGPKNENFKNSRTTFIKPPQRMLHMHFWLLKCSGYQKKLFLGENLLLILTKNAEIDQFLDFGLSKMGWKMKIFPNPK